jgi:hypothetical protein
MAVSLFLLIYLGSGLTSYSGFIDEAVSAYESEDYIAAYEALEGVDVKEKDADTKYRISMLASLESGVQSSDLAYSRGDYAEALSELIIAVGRYDEYSEDAQMLEISEKCDKILSEVEERLSSEFKVSVEEARSIYSIRKRKAYSIEIEKIISGLGL